MYLILEDFTLVNKMLKLGLIPAAMTDNYKELQIRFAVLCSHPNTDLVFLISHCAILW